MTDQTSILIVLGLALLFAAMWTFSNRQKRRFEKEQRDRKRELERIKAEARRETKK